MNTTVRLIIGKLFLIAALSECLCADYGQIDLSGPDWTLALDPVGRGKTLDWHRPMQGWDGSKAHPRSGWDQVQVPHDYLTDRRYEYSGNAWYRRSFYVPGQSPQDGVWRLQFDAVFQRCRVWINGEYVGAHEGGYTPFEFSLRKQIRPGRYNFLAIEVDNSIKFRALPGARSGSGPNATLYPWLNYGGITAGVRLTSHGPVWIASQAIRTQLVTNRWHVTTAVEIRNDSVVPCSGELTATIVGKGGIGNGKYKVGAQTNEIVSLSAEIPETEVQAWSHVHPVLYSSQVQLSTGSEHSAAFGFRSIEVRKAELLLNGRKIRLAGANRARGHPVFGGVDPDPLVEQDMRLMKDAGLIFSRIQHTPPNRNLIEWADRFGMLLVLEVGMWGYTAPDMASIELQQRFKEEMRELVVMARNSPSVVGWSLGNEYESWTPEGIEWTRRMAEYVKTLDPTRPVTFAALGTALRKLQDETAEGSHAFDYVDYISANFYFKPEEMGAYLDPVHDRWPGKPVAITEFGLRADLVKNEAARINHFDSFLAQVRARPWICGISFWSFNDYASRYPGTGADGYRRWGLVNEFREKRALYDHVRSCLQAGF